MTDIHELLNKLDACEDARLWAEGKTWEEIFNTCHRGDWLLWLFALAADAARTNNQKKTADICRKYLPIEIWNV